MSQTDRIRWEQKWSTIADTRHPAPAKLLVSNADLLPGGIAIDVACGVGQNSVWLASHHYRTLGVDISFEALKRARWEACQQEVSAQTCFAQVDLDRWHPLPTTFDLVCVFRYLNRSLLPRLKGWVRPGGVIVYQTWHMGRLQRHPEATQCYLLHPGELRQAFRDWILLVGVETDDMSSIIARRPLD